MATQPDPTEFPGKEELIKTSLKQGSGLRTNMTKTVHRSSYPAISPTRPELSQEGRTVLITGGGTGIGLAIAKAFTKAGVQTVVILGRRTAVLESAQKEIQAEAKHAGKPIQALTYPCDVTDQKAVAGVWEDLKTQGIEVNILVLNAAKFSSLGSLLDVGSDNVWSAFDVNVHGPFMMAEAFAKQGGDSPKVSLWPTSI